jgi:hypothetical protein
VRWPTRWLVPRLDDGRPLVARGAAPADRPLEGRGADDRALEGPDGRADADPLLPELGFPELGFPDLDFPWPDPFFPDPWPDPLLDGRLMWAPWCFVE